MKINSKNAILFIAILLVSFQISTAQQITDQSHKKSHNTSFSVFTKSPDITKGFWTANLENNEICLQLIGSKSKNNHSFLISQCIDKSDLNGLQANVKAKTENGNIYTDFDLKITEKKANITTSKTSNVYKVNVDKGTYGTINNGGPEMVFKTLNGNIYIKEGSN